MSTKKISLSAPVDIPHIHFPSWTRHALIWFAVAGWMVFGLAMIDADDEDGDRVPTQVLTR